MTTVLIFLSVSEPKRVLGLWACANLQGCHMDFVTGSLLLGRFSLIWILLWVSYFCSVWLNLSSLWLSCPHMPPIPRVWEDGVYEGGLKQTHPHCGRNSPKWVTSRQGVSYEDKHISLGYVHSNLVIFHRSLSFQISAGFIRSGHGTIKGVLVLDGI